MPKHAPSFKHLISTSSRRDQPTKRERSVTELLAAWRIQDAVQQRQEELERQRNDGTGQAQRVEPWLPDTPPHVSRSTLTETATGNGNRERNAGNRNGDGNAAGQRAWAVSWEATPSPLDIDEDLVHPAELLRRSQAAQRAASRTVAGPAPPPSWRSNASAGPSTGANVQKNLPGTSQVGGNDSACSTEDFRQSSALLSHHGSLPPLRSTGPEKLAQICIMVVLRLMNDRTPLIESSDDVEDHDEKAMQESKPPITITMSDALREQVSYLEPHLKIALLDISSLLPETSPARLSDQSLRAVISRSDHSVAESGGMSEFQNGDFIDHQSSVGGDVPGVGAGEDDWDDTPIDTPAFLPSEIRHLPLVAHPSPLPLLRELHLLPHAFPSFSLVSLNLGYAYIKDFERLIGVLPPGLRELSLAGLRIGGSDKGKMGQMSQMGQIAAREEGIRRGLAALGKKMLVLRTLDLSFTSSMASSLALAALLRPARSRLPSLQILGLRRRSEEVVSSETVKAFKRDVRSMTHDPERARLIEVVW